MSSVEWLNTIVTASRGGMFSLYDELCSSLRELGRFPAVAYYSYDPLSRRSVLRSVAAVEAFPKLPSSTDCISNIESETAFDLSADGAISTLLPSADLDRALHAGTTTVVVIPLAENTREVSALLPKLTTEARLSCFGHMVLFCNHNPERLNGLDRIRLHSQLLGSLILSSVHETERDLRRDLVDRTLRRRDLNSFLFASLRTVLDRLPCEGGSIFLWDKQRRLLKLHATTGMKSGLPRTDCFYTADDDRVTVQVARLGLASVSDDIRRDHARPGKHEEKVSSRRQSFAAIPILDYGRNHHPENLMPLGVLRLINRVNPLQQRTQVVQFAWDDLALLRFAAELIGVVTNYIRRGQEEHDRFERVIHGIKAQITALKLNLSHFENRPGSITVHIPQMDYIISDCVALANDVKWQVERNVAWYRTSIETAAPKEPLEIVPVKLLGDVIGKIGGLIPEMAKAINAGKVAFEYSHDEFIALPSVLADPIALTTAFRNLVENALKYTRASASDSRIRFGRRLKKDLVEILVDDNGIGVPKGEENYLFIDGYRSDNAMRRRPAGGSGIGLPHSKELLEAMGGDVYFERVEGFTRFVVSLRIAEGA